MSAETFPIILAHGIARFDILREVLLNKLSIPEDDVGDELDYFKGIKSYLEKNGLEVHHTNVSFAGPVELRAQQLSEQVSQILAGKHSSKVHIIGHSMGGLDARHMIVDIEGMADKVASLTTIGTPHLGTSIADFAISEGGHRIIDILKPIINLGGFEDLTTESCLRFNERAKNSEAANSVVYRTYASSEERDLVFLPLQASWFLINYKEGENDGLVSVKSQQWNTRLIASDGTQKKIEQIRFPIPADHLNEVGWWDLQETNPVLGLLNIEKQKKDYEDKIKNIYLQIAQNLQSNNS